MLSSCVVLQCLCFSCLTNLLSTEQYRALLVNILEWTTIGQPIKDHFGGIASAGWWWPDTICQLGLHLLLCSRLCACPTHTILVRIALTRSENSDEPCVPTVSPQPSLLANIKYRYRENYQD